MTTDVVDLRALRAFLVAHAVPGLDVVEVLADGSSHHRRLVPLRGEECLLTLTLPPGPVGAPHITVDGRPDAVAVGRRWTGLDADPAPGVAALAGDPVLGPLVRARPHLRVPGSTDPFETAVLVVLGQHVSLAAGRVFAARLVAAHASTRLGDLRAFPAPEVLAMLDPAHLKRTVGITGARANTVVAIARAVAEGTLTLRGQEDFAESGSDTALSPRTAPDFAATRTALLSIPGVGPWTADLVALRALRDPDVFLPGDLVLRQALGGATARAAATASDAWRPYRSLAVLHLWTHHAIDPPARSRQRTRVVEATASGADTRPN